MRGAFSVILLVATVLTSQAACATPPIVPWTTAIWKRTADGEVVFAETREEQLISLCIQVGGSGSWLPAEHLRDIRPSNLNEIELVRGMGLMEVNDFVPDWGLWGTSVRIETSEEEEGQAKKDPEYFFVLDKQRVAFRVLRQYLPVPEMPGVRSANEQWVSIDPKTVRRAPCRPPI